MHPPELQPTPRYQNVALLARVLSTFVALALLSTAMPGAALTLPLGLGGVPVEPVTLPVPDDGKGVEVTCWLAHDPYQPGAILIADVSISDKANFRLSIAPGPQLAPRVWGPCFFATNDETVDVHGQIGPAL